MHRRLSKAFHSYRIHLLQKQENYPRIVNFFSLLHTTHISTPRKNTYSVRRTLNFSIYTRCELKDIKRNSF